MRTTPLLTAVIVAALTVVTAFAAEREAARVHAVVTSASGVRSDFSEILFSGDIDAQVTLWKGTDGHRYVLRYAENNRTRKTSVVFSDLNTRRYLKVEWEIPVPAGTPAEIARAKHQLTGATYRLDRMTIRTASLSMTTAASPQSQGEIRSALRRDLSPEFLKALVNVSLQSANAGSPSGGPVCEILASLVQDGAVCRRSGPEPVPVETDCDFDASFGYPCR
jgi:hypothetical protein